ncbi:MAG: response regulator [Christensenellaceae bacterium]|jgi:CheY-like chemotaxis protein/signal transduction histidine kinase|nr:response regulator [Christensenellaceae bacterium]
MPFVVMILGIIAVALLYVIPRIMRKSYSTNLRNYIIIGIFSVVNAYFSFFAEHSFTFMPLTFAALIAVESISLKKMPVVFTSGVSAVFIVLYLLINRATAFANGDMTAVYLVILTGLVAAIGFFTAVWCSKQLGIGAKMVSEAERLNHESNEFLKLISHEIRTPMNAVLGTAEIILASLERFTVDDIRHNAEPMKVAGADLLLLINNILDISKIDKGQMSPTEVSYNGEAFFRSVTDAARARAEDNAVTFTTDIKLVFAPYLIGDENRLRHIFVNILQCVIANSKGGTVGLSVRQTLSPDGVVIFQADIAASGSRGVKYGAYRNYLEFLSPTSQEVQGMDLGFNLTQKLLVLMNATLEMTGGTDRLVFSLIIPQKISDIAVEDNTSEVKSNGAYSSIRALVVDDNPANLQIAKALLKSRGLTADTSTSGTEAMEKVAARVYDIIFMDHKMPGMDGLQTTKALRDMNINGSGSVPIVALSANSDRNYEELFLTHGMDAFLSKPISVAELETVLKKYIAPKKRASIERLTLNPRVYFAIKDVNTAVGIKNTDGNKDAYIVALRTFVNGANQQSEIIERAFNAKDSFTLAREAAKLKKTARDLGADKAGGLAAALEAAAKNDDRDAMTERTSRVLGELKTLRANVQSFLDSYAAAPSRRTISIEKLTEKLRIIIALAKRYRLDEAEGVASELLKNPFGDELTMLLEELKEYVVGFKEAEAAESAEKIIKLIAAAQE